MALMRGRLFSFVLALLTALSLLAGGGPRALAAPPAAAAAAAGGGVGAAGGGVGAAAGGVGAKPAGATAVLVRCATEAAEVFIDGDLVGKTPLNEPLPLSVGEHTVRVARLGYAPFIDVFKVKAGQIAKLDVELVPVAGVLVITTPANMPDPAGLPPGTPVPAPRVFVDDKYVGQAPIEHEISPGNHTIRIERPGFVAESFQVTAVAGKSMQREPALVALPPDQNPYLTKPKTKWYQKWWVWTIGAVGVAAIATAVIVPVVLSQRNVCTGVDLCASTKAAALSSAPALPEALPQSMVPALTIKF
jgi:hypothetical protein